MADLISVIKTFAITAVIVLMMQVHVSGITIESHAEQFLQRSGVAQYVQSVAAGGAMAVSTFFTSVKSGVIKSWDGFQKGSEQNNFRNFS
ncbi:MAG: hypothetical protein V4736_10395 [Bdellovibrionota bacterium]